MGTVLGPAGTHSILKLCEEASVHCGTPRTQPGHRPLILLCCTLKRGIEVHLRQHVIDRALAECGIGVLLLGKVPEEPSRRCMQNPGRGCSGDTRPGGCTGNTQPGGGQWGHSKMCWKGAARLVPWDCAGLLRELWRARPFGEQHHPARRSPTAQSGHLPCLVHFYLSQGPRGHRRKVARGMERRALPTAPQPCHSSISLLDGLKLGTYAGHLDVCWEGGIQHLGEHTLPGRNTHGCGKAWGP